MRKIISVVVAAVAIVGGLTVLTASATAPQTAAEAVAAPVAVQVTRDAAAPGNVPFYAVLTAQDDDGVAVDALPELDAPAVLEEMAFNALVNAGALGAINDGGLDAVYARVGTVVDFGTGTITVTAYGPAICEDSAERACTGREYLNQEWLAGWATS